MLWYSLQLKQVFLLILGRNIPCRVGSVALSLTNVGSLMYRVKCVARCSGYVAENAIICLFEGSDEKIQLIRKAKILKKLKIVHWICPHVPHIIQSAKVSLELVWLLAFCTVVQVTVICILGKNMNENHAKDYSKYMTSCRVKWTLHLIIILCHLLYTVASINIYLICSWKFSSSSLSASSRINSLTESVFKTCFSIKNLILPKYDRKFQFVKYRI